MTATQLWTPPAPKLWTPELGIPTDREIRDFTRLGRSVKVGRGVKCGNPGGGPLSNTLAPATLLQGCQSHIALSYAATMLATGGGPAVGISGTLTAGNLPLPVKVTITGNGTQTTATYALYLDGGTTIAQSGTCAASVSITGLPGLSATFAAGSYTTSHSYQAVASALGDPAGSDAQGYTFSGSAQPIITPGVNGWCGLLFDGANDVGVNSTLTCPAVTSMRLIYRLLVFSQCCIIGPNTNSASPLFYHPNSSNAQAFATGAGSTAAGTAGATLKRVRALFSNSASDTVRFGATTGTTANAGAGRTGTGRQLGFTPYAGFTAYANMELFGVFISSADQSPDDAAFDALAQSYYPGLSV